MFVEGSMESPVRQPEQRIVALGGCFSRIRQRALSDFQRFRGEMTNGPPDGRRFKEETDLVGRARESGVDGLYESAPISAQCYDPAPREKLERFPHRGLGHA